MVISALAPVLAPTSTAAEANDLDTMASAQIAIGEQRFQVWLAGTREERRLGLMHVPAERLQRLESGAWPGMLFVYRSEQQMSFWMRNTIAPLDIAFITDDGVITRTWTMAPLSDRSWPSVEPARFALEVRAGLLEELGIGPGDRVKLGMAVRGR